MTYQHIIPTLTGILILAFGTPALAQVETLQIDGSTGVRPLANGEIDIATASHGVDEADLEARVMTLHTIAKIAVVFGANADAEIAELTSDEVCSIYAGEITNWSEPGGADLAITAMTRPESEVDAEVVREGVPCFRDLTLADSVVTRESSGDMARALAETPGAIGMTTSTRVAQSDGRIVALALDGTAPTVEAVQDGSYRLTREAYLVTPEAPAKPEVGALLDFVKSDAGSQIVEANDAIPVQ